VGERILENMYHPLLSLFMIADSFLKREWRGSTAVLLKKI